MILNSKLIFKRDYLILPILSVMYFLTVKEVLPTTTYLISALLVSFYFFPIKLFLGSELMKSSNKRKIIVLLSYFVISNIVALTIVATYSVDFGFIRIAILIYSFLNIAFLFYFHFTESGSYNFILACCTVLLTSAVVGV